MKTSLDYLPAHKQDQLRAIVELICRSAEVEMVILYGSYARDEWVEDLEGGYISDFDIAVIVEREKLAENDALWSKIEDRADRIAMPVPVTLIVHTIKDVNRQLENGHYFFSDIKREGVLLHDSGRFRLAEAKPRTPGQRRAFAEERLGQFLVKVSNQFDIFEFCLGKGLFNEAAFALHQATEALYKMVILVFTAYVPKQHNIEKLGKQCVHHHPPLMQVFPREDLDDDRRFKLLKAAYVDARYSPKYAISREDLEALAARVRMLRELAEAGCRERIERMASAPLPGEPDESAGHAAAGGSERRDAGGGPGAGGEASERGGGGEGDP